MKLKPKILVVGDIMLDRWTFCQFRKVTNEWGKPHPVYGVERSVAMLGGAANVAANLSVLGADTKLIGWVGNDPEADIIQNLCARYHITLFARRTDDNRPTTVKHRLLSEEPLRFDTEETGPLPDKFDQEVVDFVLRHVRTCDAVVVSDYAKGLCSERLLSTLCHPALRQIERPILVDPKGHEFTRYRGATWLKPNIAEILVGNYCYEQVCQQIIADTDAGLLVTRGALGVDVWQKNERWGVGAPKLKKFRNAVGAGDALLATVAYELAVGHDMHQAVERGVKLASRTCENWAATLKPKDLSESDA